jgi:hypothetical protein
MLSVARRLRLHQAISRLLDLAGVGDNRVYVLRKA